MCFRRPPGLRAAATRGESPFVSSCRATFLSLLAANDWFDGFLCHLDVAVFLSPIERFSGRHSAVKTWPR